MTETLPEFTLNDFPNEIIERFVTDHKPSTISALKLVSKRFNGILTNDIYYKCYLHFPEQSYLCEMKCEKNSGKEVVEEIKRGAIGKWKGYLTLENVHLENLKNGRIANTEVIALPSLNDDFDGFNVDGVRWHELIDEDNEHWLLNLRSDGSIVLLNITDKPQMFVEREMYGVATELVRLLSGQVVCISYNMRHIVVLNIVHDGGKISLQYNFDFVVDILDFWWTIVTGKCGSTKSQKNLLVLVRKHPDFDGIIHFRDLKTGLELETISLWDYELLKKYQDVPNKKCAFKFDDNVDFPYIAMTLVDNHNGKSLLIVFNTETMQATSFIDVSGESVTDCFISSNVAYLFSSTCHCDQHKDIYHTSVHRLSLETRPNIEEFKTPEFLCQFYCKGLFDGVFSKHQTFAFKDLEITNKVHIVSVSETGVNDLQVFLDVDDDFKVLNVIGFDVLIIQNKRKNKDISCFKVTGEGNAVKVIDWNKMFSDNNIQFSDPCPILSSVGLSKLVFYENNVQDKDCLAIFYI